MPWSRPTRVVPCAFDSVPQHFRKDSVVASRFGSSERFGVCPVSASRQCLPNRRGLRTAGWLVLVMVQFVSVLPACDIPLFRYALERWPLEDHLLVVGHDGELDAASRELVKRMREAGADSNVEILVADATDAKVQSEFPDLMEVVEFPALLAYSSASAFQPVAYWTGPLEEASAMNLLHSPLREEILSRITNGDSVVWLLFETGDAGEDRMARAKLEGLLAPLEKELKIAEQVVYAEDYEAALQKLGSIDPRNILQSPIPLQIRFTILPISRERWSGEEAPFRSMLLQGDSGELAAAESSPVVVPVFGRGRTIGGVRVEDLNADLLRAACDYLCLACTCEDKAQNDGFDLLMKADWEMLLEGSYLVRDKTLPPLSGPGDLIATVQPPESGVQGSDPARRQPGLAAVRNSVLAVTGLLLAILVVGSIVVVRRSARSS